MKDNKLSRTRQAFVSDTTFGGRGWEVNWLSWLLAFVLIACFVLVGSKMTG